MAAVLIRPRRATDRRSKLRLFVLQVLMVSLFLTLFVRLWYVQISTGDVYQARAEDQSVREVVTQPARGLIVDDMGRPLVANRNAWVVSVDRTLLDRLEAPDRREVLHRVARVVGTSYAEVRDKSLRCGEKGFDPDTCWNGSPYQPVPVAEDVPQTTAVAILEQPEEFPSVTAATQSVRDYPSPYGINVAHVLGYLSPITEGELSKARSTNDPSLNAASTVGRSGLEQQYDKWLRGMPGYQKVAVDSQGRVLGDDSTVEATPGSTLVTSIDARVQSAVEKNLNEAITTARNTHDPVTGKNYVADQGAAVVLDAHTGRVVAMSSQPTYDPEDWVGGISSKELARLYSAKAGNPLLSRATQGQFAPGSTWKPLMSVGALNNGYDENSRLDCSSGLQVGNRWFKNYESAAYGYLDFAEALQLSCDTFFYRVGLGYWQKYGSDPANVKAKDPLVAYAKKFGMGQRTGVDLPGEATGRIADRRWKLSYFKQMKSYYCKIDRTREQDDFLKLFAHEFCAEGNLYRAGDAVNFSIGQGDTTITPLQLAVAYGALSNGGTLYEPRVAKAVVSADGKKVRAIKPTVAGKVKSSKKAMEYVDQALLGTAKTGTLAWRFGGFPLDQVPVRGKTGSAEVQGKQSTSWVATYDKDYVVIMVITQGGTGSGTSGPAVRKIWESLYGITGENVDPKASLIPGTVPPTGLPTFAPDGSILPPRASATGKAKSR